MKLIYINAKDIFIKNLKLINDPEKKENNWKFIYKNF